MNEYRYILEKYRGRSTRHRCPQCGRKHAFTRYIDTHNNNTYLSDNVGKCNRLDKCGYHYTPRQYFADNPWRRDAQWENGKNIGKFPFSHSHSTPTKTPQRRLCTLSEDYVSLFDDSRSAHLAWLEARYGGEAVARIRELYKVGSIWPYTLFWQIDAEGRVRTAKLMEYDDNGKRVKEMGACTWLHTELRREGYIGDEWELTQCLYGEHLLPRYPDAVVALVEAAKTAHVGAIVMPDMVWLSTEGMMGLTAERLAPLRGRSVILFPDEGKGYEEWTRRIGDIASSVGFRYRVSSIMEGRARGSDLADEV